MHKAPIADVNTGMVGASFDRENSQIPGASHTRGHWIAPATQFSHRAGRADMGRLPVHIRNQPRAVKPGIGRVATVPVWRTHQPHGMHGHGLSVRRRLNRLSGQLSGIRLAWQRLHWRAHGGRATARHPNHQRASSNPTEHIAALGELVWVCIHDLRIITSLAPMCARTCSGVIRTVFQTAP